MERLCGQMEYRLGKMLSFLNQLSVTIELIADEVDNSYLKNALCAVATESDQYAMELNTQLKRIEITPSYSVVIDLEEELGTNDILNSPKGKGLEVLSICVRCETFFVQLYTDLLNGYLPDASLKNMINYQLIGIKSAFMRIRLLNSLRFQI